MILPLGNTSNYFGIILSGFIVISRSFEIINSNLKIKDKYNIIVGTIIVLGGTISWIF